MNTPIVSSSQPSFFVIHPLAHIPRATDLLSVPLDYFVSSKISYKWNKKYGVFALPLSLSTVILRLVTAVIVVWSSFCWVIFNHVNAPHCLFIHLLVDIEIVSTFVYKLLYGNRFLFILNESQRELVGCAKYILNFKSSQAAFLLSSLSRPLGAPHPLQCVVWSTFFTVTTLTAMWK